MCSNSYLYTLLSLLLVTGCTDRQEEPCLPKSSSDDLIHLTTEIGGRSRTSMSGSTASFTTGDKIGVSETGTSRSNVPYTLNGTTWSSPAPIYWANGTNSHTFFAYYPYTTSLVGMRVGIPVLSTQTISTTPDPTVDFLASTPITQQRSQNVALTFSHTFSLIQLNIKMGVLQILNPYYLNRITIRGGNPAGSNRYGIVNITNNPAQVAYDLSSQTVVSISNTSQSYAQTFYSDITNVSLATTAITLYALVLPGTYANPKPGISFRITTLGITSNTAYANFSIATLQPGTKYVYNVSIGLLSRAATPSVTISLEEVVPYGDPTIE